MFSGFHHSYERLSSLFLCSWHVFSSDAFKMVSLLPVKQWDYYCPWYSFYHSSYVCGSLNFWIYGFVALLNLEIFHSLLFQISFCLLFFGGSNYMYIRLLRLALTVPCFHILFFFFPLLSLVSSLCVSTDPFYCSVFKFTNIFSTMLNLLLISSGHFSTQNFNFFTFHVSAYHAYHAYVFLYVLNTWNIFIITVLMSLPTNYVII